MPEVIDIDVNAECVRIYRTRGHWEVYINGKFYCSADTCKEAMEELLNREAPNAKWNECQGSV